MQLKMGSGYRQRWTHRQGNTTSTSLTLCAHSNPAELAESHALQKAETNHPFLAAEGSHADLGAGQTVGEDADLTPSP